MVTVEALGNTIRSRFKTEVQDKHFPTLVVIYDNAPEPQTDEIHVRFTIIWGEQVQVSIGDTGNRTFRQIGVASAQIFAPAAEGDRVALELAGEIRTGFGSVTAAGVVYKATSLLRVGRSGKWWQLNVNCPFHADEVS